MFYAGLSVSGVRTLLVSFTVLSKPCVHCLWVQSPQLLCALNSGSVRKKKECEIKPGVQKQHREGGDSVAVDGFTTSKKGRGRAELNQDQSGQGEFDCVSFHCNKHGHRATDCWSNQQAADGKSGGKGARPRNTTEEMERTKTREKEGATRRKSTEREANVSACLTRKPQKKL